MKILFISDFGLEHSPGGAQQSNDLLIKRGIQLGHEIKLHNYDSSPMDFYEHFDLTISSNLEYISKNNPEKIDFILNQKKHIRVEHDSCSYLDNNLRKKLFKHSQKNFFLSSFHIEFFKKLYGDYFNNVEIVYDPINTDIFYKKESKKEYDVVYCGFIHPLKGIEHLANFSKLNKKRKISIFGWGNEQTIKSLDSFCQNQENAEYLGTKTQKEISEVFRKCNSIFHNPIVNEPFCRMIAEGLICGCEEIIGSPNKIGSYLEFKEVGYDEFKKRCENAADIFWSKVC